ncbi:MAG TPA: ABC transporter substrate-binding protein [Bradyrhizobium sp.]|nr:ABC transporter substrate-binding protein [Bradyrhizobium sp.]
MRRRDFLIVTMLTTAMPHAAAQSAAKAKRVAMMHPAMKPAEMRSGGDPTYTIIFEELKRLGYVEGVNLIVDRYSPEGRFDRLPEIAHEIVATQPDVITTMGSVSGVKVFQSETRTIPIVAWTGDPIAGGIISSLARPGGNVTGLSVQAGSDFGGKRFELFAEAVGKLSNVRVLGSPTSWEDVKASGTTRAAKRMHIPLALQALQTPINEAEYTRAFDAMQQDHVDGVMITGESENYTYRVLLGRLAQQYRIPAICWYTDTVKAGALMSYSYDLKAGARRIAAQIVEVLNGTNPAEMPFFQETYFALVINLKAAKDLGLEIPAGLAASAEEVIE